MPSDLQRVAQGLVECLDQIPGMVGYLQRLAIKCRENASFVADSSSGNQAARTAAMQLDAAARACDEAAHLAAMAPSKARAWAEQMVSGARVATPRTSSSRQNVASHDPASPSGGSRQPEPATASTDGPSPTAHRIIKKLPIRSSPRDKTRGMWIDESGQEHKLVSGYDQYRDRADQVARDWGITNPLAVTWHVEVKFAMQMRERGLCDATIYINNPVCDGPRSCDKLLPLFLKEGSSLTVHWPDAPPKTYTGKSKPA